MNILDAQNVLCTGKIKSHGRHIDAPEIRTSRYAIAIHIWRIADTRARAPVCGVNH